MRGFWLSMLCLAALGAIVVTFFALRLQLPHATPKPAPQATSALTAPTVTFADPARGGADAKVTIVEFADFQCSACAQLSPVLSSFLASHPDVRLAWKDLPDEAAHPLAVPAAIAAHCADRQGKFWQYHDALFARQATLTQDALLSAAHEVGLDGAAFKACADGQETLAIVRKDFDEARALGLTGTPTLFIGTQKVEGAPSAAELASYVEAAR